MLFSFHERVAPVKLQRTVHGKLVLDRKGKLQAVEREYSAWQRQLRGFQEELYSATRQQADRFRRRIRRQNGYGLKQREYPLILRRDCVKIRHRADLLFKWWVRIPLHPESIWTPIQVPRSQEPLMRCELRESKLIHDGSNWYVNLTVQKEARLRRRYAIVLPVDMGVRKLATTIEEGKPTFYGKDVRRTRGAYFRLRRSVGKARIIKKWRRKEHETVRHQVHAITRRIVEKAKATNAIIAVGDLRGIRQNGKGSRRFNRRLSSQPFYLLKQFLTYKAAWEGIRVLSIPEAYTSQTCHRCGVRGHRVGGRFSCAECGLEVDADVNGAWNIAKRAHGLLVHETGGTLAFPRTLAECEP